MKQDKGLARLKKSERKAAVQRMADNEIRSINYHNYYKSLLKQKTV